MDRRPLNEMLQSVGGTANAKHRGEGSSHGQENRTLPMASSSSDVLRGGEPPTNAGRNQQPVDTRQRVGNSVVREQDVQERNFREECDRGDDRIVKLAEEELLSDGGNLVSTSDKDEEWRLGGEEERYGHGDRGEDFEGRPMDRHRLNELLGSVGRAAEAMHWGKGSSRGQENCPFAVKSSNSDAPRGGEPPTNAGCNKQPVDTRRRVGNSVVREQDVQERNSQEECDRGDDRIVKLAEEELLSDGGNLESTSDEDEEWRLGGDDERRGHGDRGGRSKGKSGWLDKEPGEGSSNRNQRRKLSKKDLPPLPDPPPDMPREFKDKINGLGGKEVTLVMQKVILTSDLSNLCRLSLPKSQFKEMGFLREEERRKLDARGEIPVRVILPDLSEKNLIFTVWEMRKKGKSVVKKGELTHNKDGKDHGQKRATKAQTVHDSDEDSETETGKARSTKEPGKDGTEKSKSSLMYILRTGWRAAAVESGLDVHDRIQVWSFRVDSDACRDQLGFALIRLQREDRGRDETG
ncbi:hypothetical protein ACJRO7_001436 [Eucalyptus globulus]|uniref:Uncharacterized protein n=1 Tax=Eucalyptus globulus TaxID=34317 RepID=A0ABD3LRX9_EUCGL